MLEELSLSCDLLVIGSRHWGAINRLLLGSTATARVGHAHCPLLVVPRGRSTTGEVRARAHRRVLAGGQLPVGRQIYLLDNPLLRAPLTVEHVKPRLLATGARRPGLNFVTPT